MDFAGLSLVKLNTTTVIKPFDCGDQALNDFLLDKAKDFYRELLATTYLLENQERTIAYFSLFTDSLKAEEEEFASKGAFKRRIALLVPHGKRHLEDFPALKIGRLAVCNTTQRNGLGKSIMAFIIDLALRINEECACKFITVDAYKASLEFYEKMGFIYFSDKDKDEKTRHMYLDLTPIINTAVEESEE